MCLAQRAKEQHLDITTSFLQLQALCQQLLPYALGIGPRQVALGDGHHDGALCRQRMGQCFPRLRSQAPVSKLSCGEPGALTVDWVTGAEALV